MSENNVAELSEWQESQAVENDKYPEELKDAPFQLLGFDGERIYYINNIKKQIDSIKEVDTTSKRLMPLATLDWWLERFPKISATTGAVSNEPDWLKAGDRIVSASRIIGVFQPERTRGRGYWKDSDRILHHRGNELVDVRSNEKLSLADSSLEYIYPRNTHTNYNKVMATQSEVDELYDTCERIYWNDPTTHPVLYFGWLVAAPFAGILPWRSHVWVTGAKGSGKSDTVDAVASVSMSKNSLQYVKGSTTEPGIRQNVSNSAVALLMDEAEPNDAKDFARIDRILTMLRNASSDDDAKTLKGTASGESQEFLSRIMAMFSSINHCLRHESDISRWAVLSLKLLPKTNETTQNFNAIDAWCDKAKSTDFGIRLELTTASKANELLANIEMAIEIIGNKMGSARNGKQYGVLVGAAATHLLPDCKREDMENLVSKLNLEGTISDDSVESNDDGWTNCWSAIGALPLPFQNSNHKVTVAEGLDWLISSNDEELLNLSGHLKSAGDEPNALDEKNIKTGGMMIVKALARYGIRYQSHKGALKGRYIVENSEQGIYLSRKSTALKKALDKTPYENWNTFSKLASQGVTPVTVKIETGCTTRAEFIPINRLQ